MVDRTVRMCEMMSSKTNLLKLELKWIFFAFDPTLSDESIGYA